MNYKDLTPETKQALQSAHAKSKSPPPIEEMPLKVREHIRKMVSGSSPPP